MITPRPAPAEGELERMLDADILPYVPQINDTPELLSLLYDINLLPEQITSLRDAARMGAICDLMKELAAVRARLKEDEAKIAQLEVILELHASVLASAPVLHPKEAG